MTTESKKQPHSSSKWPFLYSVDVQTSLVFFFTVILSLLAPFPDTAQEIENVNFIHDFIYEQLDRVQLSNTKFSSIVLLGLIYGPIKLFTTKLSLSPINVLVISTRHIIRYPFLIFMLLVRILFSFLTVSCWRFLQKRISFNYGSRVAFLFFLSEIFNWNSLNQSSKLVEVNIIRCLCKKKMMFKSGVYNIVYLVMLTFGSLIEKKFLFSLSLICLILPILRESSLNLLSSFLPLFLNREIFENDPVAMFSYLSISGVVTSIDPKPYMITNSNLEILNNPIILISMFTIISGLISRNFLILKFSFVHLIGCFLSETKSLTDSIYFPFLAVSFALIFSQFSTSKKYSNFFVKFESIGLKLVSIFLTFYFIKNSLKSIELAPGGYAALQLNDLLISESKSCPDIIKAHVSKTAQDLGFSKFSTLKNNSKISYEFGTIYDDKEMLQKFKYRVADINENIDPAYWRVRRVIKGIRNINDKNSRLHVKILSRAQAD